MRWRIVDDAELAVEKAEGGKRKAEAELPVLDGKTKRKLQEMLEWQYEFDAATKRAAKTSVTTLRRQAADDLDDEAEQVFGIQSSAKRLAGVLAPPAQNPKSEIRNPKLSATDVGTAAHKFLQHGWRRTKFYRRTKP